MDDSMPGCWLSLLWWLYTASLVLLSRHVVSHAKHSRRAKGGEIRDTKTLNLSRNIVSLQVLVDVSRFSPCMINLSRKKNICCRLKKFVAKSRAQVDFEQQILALLLVFHQTYNLSRNEFAHVARQVKGFCISCFAALTNVGNGCSTFSLWARAAKPINEASGWEPPVGQTTYRADRNQES